MKEEIKPGDLVMIVRGMACCGYMGKAQFGQTFIVDEVIPMTDPRMPPRAVCGGCYRTVPVNAFVAVTEKKSYSIYRLKKLNPPADEETRTEQKEEVTQ